MGKGLLKGNQMGGWVGGRTRHSGSSQEDTGGLPESRTRRPGPCWRRVDNGRTSWEAWRRATWCLVTGTRDLVCRYSGFLRPERIRNRRVLPSKTRFRRALRSSRSCRPTLEILELTSVSSNICQPFVAVGHISHALIQHTVFFTVRYFFASCIYCFC